jgi:hypothetical protein
MKLKFKSEDGYKYLTFGPFEFFANRQGKEGYTLEVHEWYKVPDEYQSNKHFSRRVNIAYEPPCSLDKIRERIINFLKTY